MSGSRAKVLRAELTELLGHAPTKGEWRRYKATHKYGPLNQRRSYRPWEYRGGVGGFHLPQDVVEDERVAA